MNDKCTWGLLFNSFSALNSWSSTHWTEEYQTSVNILLVWRTGANCFHHMTYNFMLVIWVHMQLLYNNTHKWLTGFNHTGSKAYIIHRNILLHQTDASQHSTQIHISRYVKIQTNKYQIWLEITGCHGDHSLYFFLKIQSESFLWHSRHDFMWNISMCQNLFSWHRPLLTVWGGSHIKACIWAAPHW